MPGLVLPDADQQLPDVLEPGVGYQGRFFENLSYIRFLGHKPVVFVYDIVIDGNLGLLLLLLQSTKSKEYN